MLFPMMSVELPPTPFAVKLRPWFIFSLILLVIIVVGKFVISDFWGGISLIFVCIMGAFVLTGDYGLNATNALFYCVMAVISGLFDIISCVLYFQHSKYTVFEKGIPPMALVAQIVFLISPVILFISAGIAYAIFSDCRDNAQESLPMGGAAYGHRYNDPYENQQQAHYQRQQQQQHHHRTGYEDRNQAGSRPRGGPVPFQGEGQRLGGSN
eukprot:gnl/TRDRNA2_/TRDRNA2_194390_c0_seq1.p2 gnl/TRDRNA2_/TRDRNA2_194390_c0~~gnl/TRDRNA2_/TRDRNA2_194390_c0_seq1.p2  ORF type:complete len:211 (-),score=42.46 gnl/TRDRNA2_/TRDRNA2_194390_c0_seq1:78-710(-)